MHVQDAFFYLISALIVFCGIGMVTSKNVFHSASFLAVVLLLVGGLYLLLHAEFLAAVQVLVYVGAVVVLMVFAVMLTSQLGDVRVAQNNRLTLPALAASLVFLGVLVSVLLSHDWSATPAVQPAAGSFTNVQSIGQALLTTFAYPFEVVSLALLAALIGAIVIARKDEE